MKLSSTSVFASVLLLSLNWGVNSAFAADTLDKIKASGKVIVGHRDSSEPISYSYDGKAVGYAVDICNNIVNEIKKEINEPNLKVEYKSVTSSTRIPELVAGNIDMECGTTTNTRKRQEQVGFSTSYYVTEVRMAVNANSGIKRISDLDGKPVVTTKGTTSDQYIKMNEKGQQIHITNIYGKDHADSLAMLASHEADAFVMDDNTLAGLIANSSTPKAFLIVGPVLSSEPYGVMLAKGDRKMKALADRVVVNMWKSGQMDQLYKKWFQSAIPPKNVNLNMAPSESFKQLKLHPNDAGIL